MLINLRNALMSGKRLPYDAEVEYLESTGTQYIDTGVVPTNTTGVLIECTVPTNNSRDNIVTGARQDSGNTRYWIDFDWSNHDTFYFGFGSFTPDADNSLRQYEGGRVQVGMNYQNGRICTLNGEKFSNLPISGSLPTITKSIYCFRANYSNPFTYSGKIFSLKITDGLTLVCDFIPVRVGTIGYLYDRVSGALFGNQGTGDFVLGPDKNA
jgi:hypothetical protein